MTGKFEIQTTAADPGGDYRLALHGSLDASAAQRLRETVLAASAAGHPRVCVDLSKVDFLASTGIGTLLLLTETLKKDGHEFALHDLSAEVSQVISLLNLNAFLKIEGEPAGAGPR